MNFKLKIVKNGKTIQSVKTHSIRRFLTHLRSLNWQNEPLKTYLRVSYGKQKDGFGRTVTFYNDGLYDNKTDLWLAFNAFIEDHRKDTAETVIDPARK